MGHELKCPDCDHQATQKCNLITDQKSVHMGLKFQCPECEYQATQKGSLITHQKRKHKENSTSHVLSTD